MTSTIREMAEECMGDAKRHQKSREHITRSIREPTSGQIDALAVAIYKTSAMLLEALAKIEEKLDK